MDWMALIGQLAFPIFACIAMGWFIKYSTDNTRQDMMQLRKEHEEEVKLLTEAINNNTLALQKLVDKMEKEDNNG